MKFFIAQNGTHINPKAITYVRKFQYENKWIVRFCFYGSANTVETLCDSKKEADTELSNFNAFCEAL